MYLDETGETWTFDVCTNTWQALNPTGAPNGDWSVSREFGELVYDIDSDRTISFGPYFVSVYDANTNTWTQHSNDLDGRSRLGWWPGFGAHYDPINERIVLINNWCCTWPGSSVSDDVWAIDMDTGERIELLATANTRTETDGS